MEDKLKELANKRVALAEYKASVKDAEAELQQSRPFVHLQNMKDHLKGLQDEVDTLSGQIKHEAETEFVRTGLENDKPHEGIQIKKFQQVRILDERAAKEWAGTHAPNTLNFKKSAFNKVVKALGSLDFVEIYSEWRAQIASDLSMYEGEQDEI